MTAENSRYSSIQATVDAIRRGEVVIVADAEDRENEGDFICAAQMVTAETINFMLRGRGQLCAPILPAACQRLELRPLVDLNTAPLQTAWCVTGSHREGESCGGQLSALGSQHKSCKLKADS